MNASFAAEPTTLSSGNASETQVDEMSLTDLIHHLEQTHHAYLKAELPVLVDQAERLSAKYGDTGLLTIADTIRGLADELFHQIRKEERVLFPLIRQLEAMGPTQTPGGSIAYPIRQMEAEHEATGVTITLLREFTNDFMPPTKACSTHQALFASLARLERDLQQHRRKENEVLFPRALARERRP